MLFAVFNHTKKKGEIHRNKLNKEGEGLRQ